MTNDDLAVIFQISEVSMNYISGFSVKLFDNIRNGIDFIVFGRFIREKRMRKLCAPRIIYILGSLALTGR